MAKIKVNKGDKFGRLTIVKEVEPIQYKKYKERRVLCQCDCGTTKIVSLYPLIIGKISSCGCYRKEKAKTHGKSFQKYDSDKVTQKIHSIWHGMKCRCNTASSGSYERYGSKGVKVCKEWENDFYAFYNWSLANGYADGLTIDRIDSDGDYEPSNCRCVDYVSQANNRKTNVRLCYNGETHTIGEWGDITGIGRDLLYQRIIFGHWDIEKAFSMHPEQHRKPLTDIEVRAIRKKRNDGFSAKDLANEYNIDISCIYNLLRGVTYKNIK